MTDALELAETTRARPVDRIEAYLDAWNQHHPQSRNLEVARFCHDGIWHVLTEPDLRSVLQDLEHLTAIADAR